MGQTASHQFTKFRFRVSSANTANISTIYWYRKCRSQAQLKTTTTKQKTKNVTNKSIIRLYNDYKWTMTLNKQDLNSSALAWESGVLTIRRTYLRNGAVKPINPLFNSKRTRSSQWSFALLLISERDVSHTTGTWDPRVPIQCSSVQDDIYALGKAHMRSKEVFARNRHTTFHLNTFSGSSYKSFMALT